MKVPLKWLREFVTIDIPVDELAERLTLAGLEVAGCVEIGEDWDPGRIMVGEVVRVRQHPDADRLTLVSVAGRAGETVEVVTGAPNIRPGMSGHRVPLALVGARLQDPSGPPGSTAVLKPARIRGVESAGMICSEKELGISEEHEGIMILPDDPVPGTPLREYLGDTVLTLDLTPNLSYCLSLEGVAREVAALGGGKLRRRSFKAVESGEPVEELVEIEILAPALSPRYCAALLSGVKVEASPFWTQYRLRLAGIRPINNIVDATNYVMWETGQPLHAFDYDLLRGVEGAAKPKIVVRCAREGEKLTTLDGLQRVCRADTLLICDGAGPVALAGIMGGKKTEVTARTSRVLIESANFDRSSIRRTAGFMRLPSEASLRFGRGVPADGALGAARRAADLLRKLAGGEVARGTADAYPRPQERRVLRIDPKEVERTLGIPVSIRAMTRVFRSLGFSSRIDRNSLRVEVPSFRLDIGIGVDLVEEVARVTGYDKIPTAPMSGEFAPPQPSPRLEAEARVRDILTGCGLFEVITYSLTDPSHAIRLGLERDRKAFMALSNPMTADRTHLRRHLLPGLLETLRSNLRFTERVAVFELARVYHPSGEGLPAEPRRLGILLSGPRSEPWWGEPLPPGFDLFHLKGILQTLAGRMGVGPVDFVPEEVAPYRRGRAAAVKKGAALLGRFGELDPPLGEVFDLPESTVVLGELDLEAFLSQDGAVLHRGLSRYPILSQDLALICPEDLSAARLEEVIRKAAGELLVDLRLFDFYRGPQVEAGKKSLAYTLIFQAPDRTLNEKEINRVREGIVKAVGRKLQVELRSL